MLLIWIGDKALIVGRQVVHDDGIALFQDVLNSLPYIQELSERTGLPVKMTCVRREFSQALAGRIENLFSMDLQRLYYMLNTEVPNGKTDI